MKLTIDFTEEDINLLCNVLLNTALDYQDIIYKLNSKNLKSYAQQYIQEEKEIINLTERILEDLGIN